VPSFIPSWLGASNILPGACPGSKKKGTAPEVALSSDKIHSIRESADIVRVIGTYVSLKKQGQRYLGLCPFHSENTPSFSVSPAKGLYYCFGCHAGGDVFSFLMRHQGLDFLAAVRRLAVEAGVELEPESPQEKKRRLLLEELARVNDYAQAFFSHALWQDEGRDARAYLAQRGIAEPFARERGLGYGGASGQLLAYLDVKKVPREAAGRAGLLSEDGRRCLFDGRLVFPITDGNGRVAGFSGRRLGEGSSPKYLNSRETVLFAKRRLLYGWDVAQDAMRKSGRVILVEGQTDVLACQRAGLGEAVAALGTAFTDDHARACARLAKEAVVAFDGDPAGRAASREAVQRLLAARLKTLVTPLAPGQDPDSLLAEAGEEGLGEAIGRAQPALEYFIGISFEKAGLSIEDRAEAARAIAPLLAALPSGLERDLYTARLAEEVGVSVDQLRQHLRAPRATRQPAPAVARAEAPAPSPGAPSRAVPDRFEYNILRDLLLYPEVRPRFGELAEFSSDFMRLLLEDLAGCDDWAGEVLARHIESSTMVQALAELGPADDTNPEELSSRANRAFNDVLSRLKARHVRATIGEIRREVAEGEARGEDVTDLQERLKNLTRRERELKRPGRSA
jgi:DNA primase